MSAISIFGVGPHVRVGLNLLRCKADWSSTSSGAASGTPPKLTGEVEYDPNHLNARRMNTFMVRT